MSRINICKRNRAIELVLKARPFFFLWLQHASMSLASRIVVGVDTSTVWLTPSRVDEGQESAIHLLLSVRMMHL